MKNIRPQQPSHISPYAKASLDALVKANLANQIGSGLGLFHCLDYRPLDQSTDSQQREQARQLRHWFLNVYLQVDNE